MRKLTDLIVLIRGGGEVGTAIAHKLTRSHFRVCITELAFPSAINRGTSFSEAVFESVKSIEDVVGERAIPSLEHIYKVWRNGNIPVVVDPELSVKPLLQPDVLINAMMLKRETNTKVTDAPLVVGIGPGFNVGTNVHMVIGTNSGSNLGKVLVEGQSDFATDKDEEIESALKEIEVTAEDAGVFTTDKNIGDAVLAGDIVGNLNDVALKAPISGMLRGILRSEIKVLANARLFDIDPLHDKKVCFSIREGMRTVAGGVLESIMMGLNVEDIN
jgi:xanthine dehydrogenase accessory factor